MRAKSDWRILLAAAALALAASPALAGDRLEKTFDLKPGGRFRLQTGLGRVRVTGKPGAGAHMVVTSRRGDLDDLLSFHYDESPGSVTVTARSRHHLFVFHSGSVEFQIEVPSETSVDVDTSGGSIEVSALRSPAKLETSGGSISVSDLGANLRAHTSGGSIHLRQIHGQSRVDTSGGNIEATALSGPLYAETSGGSIRLEDLAGDADVHTSGGGIRIRNAGGSVRAETSGGSIDATFAKGNARGGWLESSGGGITVALDPGIGLSIDARGSHVQTDLPLRVQGEISRGSLRGALGNGGETLRLRTSGGGIRIQPL